MKTIVVVAGAALLTLSLQAGAVDLLSTSGTGPTGNCQAALPTYEGLVRKRPLAVTNEGDAQAFVTCALATEEVSLNVQSFATRISNLSGAPATISCTAVIGDELEGADYIVKSATLAPLTSGSLTWTTADNGGLLFAKSVAISCNLPPMTGLNRNRITTLLSLI